MNYDAVMKHLWWRFWYASRHIFLKPGIYFCWHGNWRVLPLLSLPPLPELVEFPEQNVIYAKNQPEYRPLPAYRFRADVEGRIIFCWRLSWRDRLRVLFAGVFWHQVATFNEPLQPQLLLVRKPKMENP